MSYKVYKEDSENKYSDEYIDCFRKEIKRIKSVDKRIGLKLDMEGQVEVHDE